MVRRVTAEALDTLDPDDPAAIGSRRDLQRLHRAMGTRSILRHGLQGLMAAPREAGTLRVLELGAGDGTLLLGLARALAPVWPQVELTLLDRQRLVSDQTRAGFAELGWTAVPLTVDVVDWAAACNGPLAVGNTTPGWHLIVCSLFLHHFEGPQLDALLAAVAARGERFFACEPRRAWLALAGSHLVGVLGANAVTREDAVLSVHAGFRGRELSARWPGDGAGWQLREYAAGLFSHCFRAAPPQAV